MQGIDVRAAALYMKFLAVLGVRWRTQTLASGERMRLRTNDALGRKLVVEKWFEPRVREKLRQHVRPGATVLDVGANIGYYTVQAATLVGPHGRVVAFEPQPSMRQELAANLALNRITNVTIMPYALSDRAAIAHFCVPTAGHESMGSLHSNARFKADCEIEVETRCLDDVLESASCTRVDLVKLDAEGAELPIVKGASGLLSGPNRPYVVFEANEENCAPFGYRVFDLLKAFWDFGYQLTQIDAENWFAEGRRSEKQS
jgi:FkbM family methyltransferase